METITASRVRSILPRRDPAGHKGDFGKLLCVCGSVGYTGAPVFASRAAVRTGAGLVFLAVPEQAWPVVAVKSEEAMPFPLPETAEGRLSLLAEEPIRQRAASCDAVLIGCGLGRDRQTDAAKPAERNCFVQPCSFRFRRKRLQPSGILTYPPSGGFTVTDSRGFSPHSTCKHMACANYPIFIFYYYSIKFAPCHPFLHHFLIFALFF